MMEACLVQSTINGSDTIKTYTATSKNGGVSALSVDMLTNYFGSVCCALHTVVLFVKDVFNRETLRQSYTDQANYVTTHFNQYQKAAQMLVVFQLESGLSNDRLVKLKHDVPTRCHSQLSAVVTYMTHADLIQKVVSELNVLEYDLRTFKPEKEKSVTEYIITRKVISRAARALKADR